jgi:hypothetical protein
VMAADRPYGKFYNFYSISPEYFVYTLVYHSDTHDWYWLVQSDHSVWHLLLVTYCLLLCCERGPNEHLC